MFDEIEMEKLAMDTWITNATQTFGPRAVLNSSPDKISLVSRNAQANHAQGEWIQQMSHLPPAAKMIQTILIARHFPGHVRILATHGFAKHARALVEIARY